MSTSNNNKFLWKLNTRLRISVLLIIILFLLAYQIFVILNQFPDILEKPKQWWNDTTDTSSPSQKPIIHAPIPPSSEYNKLGDDVILYNVSSLTKIQYDFPYSSLKKQFIETKAERKLREDRKESIKKGFLHAWNGYVKYGWGSDEILPITNTSRNNFNGWGATMVDALDTMWIMNLKAEFTNATNYLANVNFTNSRMEISVFETTIRYLGGLLSAYELSGKEILLIKAIELGEAMLVAFDSPSGLPYNDLNITRGSHKPIFRTGVLSQVGTLQLEFMKLAELTGNSTFFYAVQKVTDVLDKARKEIPGLYPLYINIESGKFTSHQISFGAMGDSFYEYLIKQYVYVGGAIDQYRRMYEESIDGMHKYLVKEGQVKDRPDLLFLGEYTSGRIGSFISRMEHLSCFTPGMLAIGSKILHRPKDLEVAIRLAESCYWAYNSTTTGIGPESMYFLTKDAKAVSVWHHGDNLPDGLYRIDGSYLLRPETIESLFILYRITGNKKYQEKGWKIWQSIEKWCKTPIAYSGLRDVMDEKRLQNNNMESFFLAETLKYLYLLFSTPDVISLDNYVFNTEAHPFLRMTPK
ncbi:8593_t:CDS:2 [Funneliformis caledonium]|uniref:alpha-1,2-Mannosidase n=1 Tax=Funneliformis caledonium TaxID=1117310 RepID=A0A9N8W2R7_9GLOM|nr:8593_t:CDS:2 [Funneliformis caledonium]